MKKYSLTEEHRSQLVTYNQKWIDNGLSTKPMDDHDKEEMRKAIKGLYESANLTPPPESRIVFVPSPMVARFAAGFASAIWYLRKNNLPTYDAIDDATYDATDAAIDTATYTATYNATRDATDDATSSATRATTESAIYAATHAATRDATRAATNAATRDALDAAAARAATYAAAYDSARAAIDAATRDATYAATDDATSSATRNATDAATYGATRAATRNATDDATDAATYAATRDATDEVGNDNWYTSIGDINKLAKELGLGNFGLACVEKAWRMQSSGNFWSGWCSFLSFFKDVVKLDIDYSKYVHFEKACIHGSIRFMHKEFCIVSDRPIHIKLQDGVPHCENDAYIKWSDGTGFYAWKGIRVPEWFIMNPEKLTPEIALTWKNVEQRRCAAEIMGWDKVFEHPSVKTRILDTDEPHIGELLEVDLPDAPKSRFMKVLCGTGRTFILSVPDTGYDTALEANASLGGWRKGCGDDPIQFIPIIRT